MTPPLRRLGALAACLTLALGLAACSDDDQPTALDDLTGKPAELAEQGTIRIGVKYDQPGVGYRAPGAVEPTGFDIEIAKLLAGRLGIGDEGITWVEAVSENREPLLERGAFDIVIASYSITDERRELVGQAGPYLLTGQQVLVRTDEDDAITGPDDLDGRSVCSVSGSTSLTRVEDEYGADAEGFKTYSECARRLRNGRVDAVSTDGAILLGYAARYPEELEVVGDTFSEERYGIGYPKDAEGMCAFINEALTEAFDDGSWAEAFESTLGGSGEEAPDPPELDECP